MYSRFDIVWPDALGLAESRKGVDALTFGLATLVMREDVFGSVAVGESGLGQGTSQSFPCQDCDHINYVNKKKPTLTGRLRRGNFFSQYVKKFSLANGPDEYVQEYLLTKEAGKMLGTLVALSVARMPNLETFIWDMPTGIVRDVWISLSSLGDLQPQNLDKVFIRFHNNRKALANSWLVRSARPISTQSPSAAIPSQPVSQSMGGPSTASLPAKFIYSAHYVESPNFSILPPLRSLSALAIDELSNLNELSLLVGKSIDQLRELRVGIATELHSSGLTPTSRAMKYLLDNGSLGTLSLLFSSLPQCSTEGRYSDSKADTPCNFESTSDDSKLISNGHIEPNSLSTFLTKNKGPAFVGVSNKTTVRSYSFGSPVPANIASIDPLLISSTALRTNAKNDQYEQHDNLNNIKPSLALECQSNAESHRQSSTLSGDPSIIRIRPDSTKSHATRSTQSPKKLRLEILELERHAMNARVLKEATDWSLLTSLTLLKCIDTDEFWAKMKDSFAPMKRSRSPILSIPMKSLDKKTSSHPQLRRMPSSPHIEEQPQLTYRLNLKHIHTDTVSTQLIAFLKEAIAPNSLQCLFLQDCTRYQSSVPLSKIHKSVLKRHHKSLTKLLVNSSHGLPKNRILPVSAEKWMVNREILA